ncbi:type III-B CRISPR module-associated protein Cmr3 [Lyngbya sp. CCAP 1446/10]|uniref:type III-B CRISPR module-associated protein Cmr3 n=1 Tax=Lyngbya sp. CCAP 1446/10 TaxID=439293 RepID=UPI002237A20D|nr:type III-B CRISPR module-associated protein Cmr3 [Lyngbya sp. CCAP 1446/10]MCW6051358.1 type III-B CRISPR module-associated protein Cmr3 [Lyngbya sp. CCAP 1446/10]
MSINSNSPPAEPQEPKPPFSHLVTIQPLGLLYGSAGRFLSPENLVGRSGSSFPPSAATLSGIFAAELRGDIKNLQLAGPFWGKCDELPDFYVPTPLNYLIEKGTSNIKDKLSWNALEKKWTPNLNEKFEKGGWVKVNDWGKNNSKISIKVPWKTVSHLHPRLEENQRRVLVEKERDRGSLFLENGVQLDPDYCLVYLSNTEIVPGWYRFGGEGHLVNIECQAISDELKDLLSKPVGEAFALITPAVWGSNRHSYREPMVQKDKDRNSEWVAAWDCEALLTERPSTFRYRFGNPKDEKTDEKVVNSKEKLLSRGRYAVPAGSVYVLKKPLKSWEEWDENWFPTEGVSFKRWGCGLALPLPSVLAQKTDIAANTSEILPIGGN